MKERLSKTGYENIAHISGDLNADLTYVFDIREKAGPCTFEDWSLRSKSLNSGYKHGSIDLPIRGARTAITRILQRGDVVVIFTTRNADMVRAWLRQHAFPDLEVTSEKRPFYVIVDDRAINFTGVWDAEFEKRIADFHPYWLGDKPAAAEQPWPEDDTSAFDVRL
ncbi:MAG: hypothetical protein EOO40_00390 [Deltaproteobacteria bacterium]|nr:MAG: hypothetical protein EOO40_00390 [Deltaproteobacteria bacterium]